jgi:hypothetical protein
LNLGKMYSIFLILISLSISGWCGKIIYPWNATTAIVKAGESFTVWFDADEGQNISSVELFGPYNSVSTTMVANQRGSWIYDEESGNTYNTRIVVSVPSLAPEDRYDLVLITSAGEELSPGAVKIIREYRKDFTIFHKSDTIVTSYMHQESFMKFQKIMKS